MRRQCIYGLFWNIRLLFKPLAGPWLAQPSPIPPFPFVAPPAETQQHQALQAQIDAQQQQMMLLQHQNAILMASAAGAPPEPPAPEPPAKDARKRRKSRRRRKDDPYSSDSDSDSDAGGPAATHPTRSQTARETVNLFVPPSTCIGHVLDM